MIRRFKKQAFRLHGWIGIKLGILFFTVCLTGTIATLSHELDWVFNSEIRATPQPELVGRNAILANLREAYPEGKIEYWMRPEEAYLCDIVYVRTNGIREYVFTNRYTGEVQGSSRLTIQRFFRDFHYFLFIPFQIGHFTVLLFGFLLFFSLITALIFYKKWWKKLFDLKRGKNTLVLLRSLHRLAGLWSIPFTIIFSLTGIWYFLERSNAGGLSKEVNPAFPKIESRASSSSKPENLTFEIDYDKATETAQQAIPGLRVTDMVPPQNEQAPIYITGKTDVPLVRSRANRVYLDPYSYEKVEIQKADSISNLMWLNDIADPLHFGYWGGLITKIIWFIFGLGITSLVYSGLWISIKRRYARNQRSALGAWKIFNWSVMGLIFILMNIVLIKQYQIFIQTLIAIDLSFILVTWLLTWTFNLSIRKTGR